MEINASKFHVEEATVRGVNVSKNKIYYYFEFSQRWRCCVHCYEVTNNEFNHPLTLTGTMFRNLYKGNDKVWILIYGRRIIAIAPTITALAKNDFCAIDAKEATVKLLESWLEVQNGKPV